MSVPQYLPGEWVAVVTDGCIALVPAETPPATVRALWDSMRSTGAPSLVDHLQVLTAGGLTSLPPFALLSLAPERLHAVVRGAVEVDVTAGGRTRVLTARHVSTWTEEVVDDLEAVAVRAPGVTWMLGSMSDAVAGRALPLVSGTVRAGAVQLQLKPVLADDVVVDAGVVDGAVPAEAAAVGEAAARDEVAARDEAAAVAEAAAPGEAAATTVEKPADQPVHEPADDPAEQADDAPAYQLADDPADEPWSDTVPALASESVDSVAMLAPAEPEPEPLHELARILAERSIPSSIPSSVRSPAPVPASSPARRPGGTATATRALPFAPAPALAPVPDASPAGARHAVPSPSLAPDELIGDTLLRPADRLPVDATAGPAAIPAFATNPVLADVLADHDGTTVLSPDVVALRNQLPDWAGHALPTPVVTPASSAPARIVLSTGDTVTLDRPVLLGRAPQVSRVSSSQIPRLVTVPSPLQDISRTHAEVRMDGDDVVLTDLRSTNGVLVVRPHAAAQRLQPGEATVLQPGVLVDLGEDVTFTVERDA